MARLNKYHVNKYQPHMVDIFKNIRTYADIFEHTRTHTDIYDHMYGHTSPERLVDAACGASATSEK
jgi:hypothetical protein